ncbi:hypothetical protein TBLA_0A09270 [Henningerozyma blattae CBS 6284]|uniref:DASH complex subunit DAD2 n=1 Tax=Henningerozyma blattae (strain ATCC 34711 / CBS 6284 / DSM 70876 / NBRC 10599 / NRRL Y-10934 / UCD 77-7) TaxID=1071380 RepID=I2GX62_HENB6|nr:hypothetical protein TBLA_0A09270 [Tetrapisispora blattae CBS 6284]CCH58714.1 hypothetical protein TBLA_0A09270 [Tetrapisispora blattae CBS 6284]
MEPNSLEHILREKTAELQALKQITSLTDNLKVELEQMAIQTSKIRDNSASVSEVTDHWNSILRSISQASLKILQYTQSDYEVGSWKNENNATEKDEDKDNAVPLPETLVRIRTDDDDK